MPGLPLEGVRIVDFSMNMAGPNSTTLLAFLGAQVIKIESRKHPDFARIRSPQGFSEFNHNKLCISLDLNRTEAVQLVRRLVSISDVVVESFRPGVMERWGLDYETLRKIKPDIIMLSLTGFGSHGPESHFGSFADIFSAMGGLANITGYPDGIPTEMRAVIDVTVGQMAAFAVLVALVHHRRTGKGQNIDMSARETIISFIGEVVLDYTMNHRNQVPKGNQDDIMAPHNCYPCKGENKWLTIAIATEEEWRALCQAMGNPPWTRNIKFDDQLSRWENQKQLDKHISEWTINYTPDELMHGLQEKGVAAVPSFSCEDLFYDRHLRERGYIQELNHVEQSRKRSHLSGPWRLGDIRPVIYRRSPDIGQDNAYVFGELLGMPWEKIAKLEEEQIIY